MLNFASKGIGAKRIAPGADPYFTNVVMLAHMDGTNGGTSFPDVKGNTITPNSVTTDTSAKKFGSASAQLQASSGSYLSIANNTRFDFGSADFTMEAWINCISTGSSGGGIFGRWGLGPSSNADFIIAIETGHHLQFVGSNVGVNLIGTSVLTDSIWHHVAVVRKNNTITLYVDGVSEGSAAWSGAVQYTAAMPIRMGIWDSATSFFNGHIDEVRITKGVARYTANFTPPSSPFPDF